MLHFAIKNANSKIKSKNSLWAKNKKNTVYTDAEIIGKFPHPRYTNKKPHLPVFMLKIDKCGEI